MGRDNWVKSMVAMVWVSGEWHYVEAQRSQSTRVVLCSPSRRHLEGSGVPYAVDRADAAVLNLPSG